LLPGWRVIADHDCDEGMHAGPTGLFEFRGFLLERASP
jgi:hypothetical protein